MGSLQGAFGTSCQDFLTKLMYDLKRTKDKFLKTLRL